MVTPSDLTGTLIQVGLQPTGSAHRFQRFLVGLEVQAPLLLAQAWLEHPWLLCQSPILAPPQELNEIRAQEGRVLRALCSL